MYNLDKACILRRCLTDEKYILLDCDKNDNIYVTPVNKTEITKENKNNFVFVESYVKIGVVVSLVKTHCTEVLSEYNYYKEDENSITIMAENNLLVKLNKEFLIRKEQWGKLNSQEKQKLTQELTEKMQNILEKQKELAKQKERELEEQKIRQKEREIEKQKTQLKRSLLETIIKNSSYTKKETIELEPVSTKIGTGFFNCGPVEILYRKKERKIDQKEIDVLKKLNQCPLEILGKIKYIENEITILEYEKVSLEILKTIKELIGIIISFFEYEINEETLTKTEELFKIILIYLKEIKKGDEKQKEYIENKLADQINQKLDENIELFSKMTEDYHCMYDWTKK